jgi:RNA polymerase sigma-70 factor (ECF subfamily)
MTAYAVDLYLCAACVAGQPLAFQTLEELHFPAVTAVFWQQLGDRATVQELLQELRIRLFVGASPRIATYRGRGPLAAWLRTIALHAAQDHLRASNVQRGHLLQLSCAQQEREGSGHAQPSERESLLFGQRRERIVERACSAAMAGLERGQRQLLHHHFVAGLSIDELSPMYSVHRATIARRIQRVIEHLRSLVRRELTARYQLSGEELEELLQETWCELELSAELFAGEAPAAARMGHDVGAACAASALG